MTFQVRIKPTAATGPHPTLCPGEPGLAPNAEQLTAVKEYAALYGRQWKSRLREAWMSGNYAGFNKAPLLQQVRNEFGPAWLVRFSLKEAL